MRATPNLIPRILSPTSCEKLLNDSLWDFSKVKVQKFTFRNEASLPWQYDNLTVETVPKLYSGLSKHRIQHFAHSSNNLSRDIIFKHWFTRFLQIT